MRKANAYAGRPSVCRQCGALVGAGEADCMMCGAPAGEALRDESVQHSASDHERLRFIRAIVSRPATFTFAFIIACVFLYLLMEMSGGASGSVLEQFGAKVNHKIIGEGQWWRFVTPIFLHVSVPGLGPLHLIVNMYGLFMLGPFVEKLYGSAKFVFFWVITGIAGFLVSYASVRPELARGVLGSFLFKSGDASAGSSAALFGLIGVLFVFGIKYRRELPDDFKRAFGFGMLPMIVLNLFIGYFAREMIDNAAHLGGLVSGMGLAALVDYKRPGERQHTELFWRLAQVALLALVFASFVLTWSNFRGPQPEFSRLGQNIFRPAASPAYVEAINESLPAFDEALKGNTDPSERIIKTLDALPVLSPKEQQLRGELKALLISAQQIGSSVRAGQRKETDQAQVTQMKAAFIDWNQRYEQWVSSEGINYGMNWKKSEEK